ncbi:unnamed protein product [Closterium sp. NIES-65]|nr:unnamed protein product [Closterium sp. NIES-65]
MAYPWPLTCLPALCSPRNILQLRPISLTHFLAPQQALGGILTPAVDSRPQRRDGCTLLLIHLRGGFLSHLQIPSILPSRLPRSLQWTAALNAVTAALYFSFTSVVALVTFATFTCLGGQLTAASVFYVLTLLEVRCTSPCFPSMHLHRAIRKENCISHSVPQRAPLTAAAVFYMLAHVPPGTSFLASVPLSRALTLRANSVLEAPHKHPHVPRRPTHSGAVFYMLAHAPIESTQKHTCSLMLLESTNMPHTSLPPLPPFPPLLPPFPPLLPPVPPPLHTISPQIPHYTMGWKRFMSFHAAAGPSPAVGPSAAAASADAAGAAALEGTCVTAQEEQEGHVEIDGARAPSGRGRGSEREGGRGRAAGSHWQDGQWQVTAAAGYPRGSASLIRRHAPLRASLAYAYASQQVCLPFAAQPLLLVSLSPLPYPLPLLIEGTPFLIEGTVRENILFGTPLDEALYAKSHFPITHSSPLPTPPLCPLLPFALSSPCPLLPLPPALSSLCPLLPFALSSLCPLLPFALSSPLPSPPRLYLLPASISSISRHSLSFC